MPPSETRWQIGQIAICHCDPVHPRELHVLRGRTPPWLGDANGAECHECETAARPGNVGRPGERSTMIRLSLPSIATARKAAASAQVSPRRWIEDAIAAKSVG